MMNLSYYKIDRRHPAAITALCLIVLSAVIRIVYFSTKTVTFPTLAVHVLLVVAAAVLFVFFVLTCKKYAHALTLIPVALGVAFFIIKSLDFASTLHTALCICLYCAVLFLYGLTVLGVIRQKLLLYPLFGLPLIYHIIEDAYELLFLPDAPPLFEWLPELSVLCIMGALLAVSVALQKRESAPARKEFQP